MTTTAEIATDFGQEFGLVLNNPTYCRDRCESVSQEFADRLQAAGIQAEVVTGVKFGETPEFPGARMLLAGHFAVQVGDRVYDWTARQFDPDAPVPLVTTIEQWRQEWSRLGKKGDYKGTPIKGHCQVCGKKIVLKRGLLVHADGSNDHAVVPSDDAPLGVTSSSGSPLEIGAHEPLRTVGFPSWRDRGEMPQADCVIAPDLGRSKYRNYQVFTYGDLFGRYQRLTDAQQAVEAVYGPLDWRKIPGDRQPHYDPVWGNTTMFNDAAYFMVVDYLPTLGQTTAVLSLEDVISVAEHVMEDSGNSGRWWDLSTSTDYPKRFDNPAYWKAMEPVTEFVNRALTHGGYDGPRIKVVNSDYGLGDAQAMTDGLNSIQVRDRVNDLTLLHECAHIINRTREGQGHDKAFVEVLGGLYRDFISPGAADQFYKLVTGSSVWSRTAAYGKDLIARGLTWNEIPEPVAQKIIAGTVTARDFLDHLQPAGVWWGIMGDFGDLVDFQDQYAGGSSDADLTPKQMAADGYVGEHYISGEVGVVLVAKRPIINGKLWDPQEDNPVDALMGNSYLPDGTRLQMVEVWYNAEGWHDNNETWKRLPCLGMSVVARQESKSAAQVIKPVAEMTLSGDEFEALCQKVLDAEMGRHVPIDFELLYGAHPHLAEASWDGERAYIGWQVGGLNVLVALHECAHVLLQAQGQDDGEDDHPSEFWQLLDRLAAKWVPSQGQVVGTLKQSKALPSTLYHFTSQMHLPIILQAGYLKLTESNLSAQRSHAGPDVVWLTESTKAEGNGVYDFKSSVRFTIANPPPTTFWWPDWSREHGIEQWWYDALAAAAGEGAGPDKWWVCETPLRLDRYVTSIEVDGQPIELPWRKQALCSGMGPFWHVTPDADFRPDSTYKPRDAKGEPGKEAMLWLTPQPSDWTRNAEWFGVGTTLYAFEIELPADQYNRTWAYTSHAGLSEVVAWGESVDRAKVLRRIVVSEGGHKQAVATRTVYRGIYIELSGDDVQSGSIEQLLLRRVLSGTGADIIQVQRQGAGAGAHWSLDKRVAIDFSDPFSRRGEPKRLGTDGWTVKVPMVLTAKVSDADVVTDPEELRDAMVEGHGWTGLTFHNEQEVLVRPGARLQVMSVEALCPSSWEPVEQALDSMDAGPILALPAHWKQIGGGLTTTAAAEFDQISSDVIEHVPSGCHLVRKHNLWFVLTPDNKIVGPRRSSVEMVKDWVREHMQTVTATRVHGVAPNWVNLFNGSGQTQYQHNAPYVVVGLAGGPITDLLVPNDIKVPVPWQGDVAKCVGQAEQKAKGLYAQSPYDRWSQSPNSQFVLKLGSNTQSRIVGVGKQIGAWGPPIKVEYTEPWSEFLPLLQRDPAAAWVQVCQVIADAQPPGYNSHPALDRSKVTSHPVYRGIRIGAGVDPLQSVSSQGGGVGTSWTLDLNAAKAIAERGGAGFSGEQDLGKSWRFRGRPNPEEKSRAVVLRAEVDLTSPGTALLTDGRMYYASEQEVDIQRGTQVKITGVLEAEQVFNQQDLQRAQRAQDAGDFEHSYYNVTYRWPSTFKTVNLTRTADTSTWLPTKGMFAHGKDTLDPRVFDLSTNQMRADVRNGVLGDLDAFWRPRYGDWTKWAKVYLAGSGASYWWDSDVDMDILIGINMPALISARPQNEGVSEADVCAHFDHELKAELDPTTAKRWYASDSGPWEVTFFCNPGSWDIEGIKPYAAYDITDDGWVQKPPLLPKDWGPQYFPADYWMRAKQIEIEVREILALPEPARTQAGVTYFDRLHSWRQLAYSPHGTGWTDFGNVIWQTLSQTPDHLLARLYKLKHPVTTGSVQAIHTTSPLIPFTHRPGEKPIDTTPLWDEIDASYSWVHPQIAVGGAIRYVSDLEELVEAGITGIVSGRSDFDDAVLAKGLNLGMKFLDDALPDDGKPKPVWWFAKALDFALPILRSGGKVYGHCHSGINRGPSLVYAILRAYTGIDRDEAVWSIRQARPFVRIGYIHDADVALKELGYTTDAPGPSLAPFMHGQAAKQRWFYPSKDGGKYHEPLLPMYPQARCKPSLWLDDTAGPIVVTDPDKAHPFVCRKCLNKKDE